MTATYSRDGSRCDGCGARSLRTHLRRSGLNDHGYTGPVPTVGQALRALRIHERRLARELARLDRKIEAHR